jgi:hypothetical protein
MFYRMRLDHLRDDNDLYAFAATYGYRAVAMIDGGKLNFRRFSDGF